MRRANIIIIFFCFSIIYAHAQKSASYIGIKPEVTVEPFYLKGEFDVNLFPFVFQKTMTRRMDIRLSPILNLGVRKTNSSISHLGFQVGTPIFLKKKDEKNQASTGIYFEPGMGLTRNKIEKHNNIGLWLEPGYHLQIDEKWAMSFGIQFGATYFDYDALKSSEWKSHFGVKIIIGRWLL